MAEHFLSLLAGTGSPTQSHGAAAAAPTSPRSAAARSILACADLWASVERGRGRDGDKARPPLPQRIARLAEGDILRLC